MDSSISERSLLEACRKARQEWLGQMYPGARRWRRETFAASAPLAVFASKQVSDDSLEPTSIQVTTLDAVTALLARIEGRKR